MFKSIKKLTENLRHHIAISKILKLNSKRCNSIGQVMGLIFKNYQFESHKPQSH